MIESRQRCQASRAERAQFGRLFISGQLARARDSARADKALPTDRRCQTAQHLLGGFPILSRYDVLALRQAI